MDHRHGLFEDELTLEKCLERVQVLFYDEITNSESLMNLNYLDELLSKLHEPSHQSNTVTRRVASFVRDVATFHPNACHLLLIHLPYLLDPVPFIEIMPPMFCIASPSLIIEAVAQLKVLPERDSRLLLPVLCAMADLHLKGNLSEEFYSLAEEAIGTLEEAELPALFRAILKSVCPLRAGRTILKLRDEMLNISESSMALLVEVMWEVLPSSSGAAEVFLNEIILDQEMQSLRQPPLTDLAIVLILTSNIGALKSRARVLLEAWLKQGTFPFSQLELVLSLRRSNEIWERMIPAVWRLCLWTLESLTDYESGASKSSSGLRGRGCVGLGDRGRVYLTNKEGLSRTVLRLCECMPSMRQTVVSNLLVRCYAEGPISSTCSSSAVHDSVSQERDGAWLMNSYPLGSASAQYGIVSLGMKGAGSFNITSKGLAACAKSDADRPTWIARTKIRRLEMHKVQSEALLASTVLESLVGEHPEIGASVLSSIMDRLTPSSFSQGGLLALPPAAILHSLAGCIISGTCSSPQIENTVFIVIQKLLGAGQSSSGVDEGNYTLLNVLRHPTMTASACTKSMKGSSSMDSDVHSLQIKHSTGTVGCFLSGHLLLRDRPHCLSDTDFGAVLAWLTRAFKNFSDIAIACALDILVACIHREGTQGPRSPIEAAGRMSLLVAAADTCLQKVLKLKALALCGDDYKAAESDVTYVADVALDHHHSPQSRLGMGPGSARPAQAVMWNVTALSTNLISTEIGSDRSQGSECVAGRDRAGDIAMVASSAFWVLHRASALHCVTRTTCSNSDTAAHRSSQPQPLSVGIILGRSELDIPDKTPWMSDSAAAAAARHNEGRTPSEAAVAPKSKGQRATRSAASKAESDAAKSSLSPGLFVWACSAADSIEGLTFTRSLSLSASEILSLAWERALCSAVLLGYFPEASQTPNSPSRGLEALLRVGRLLCQTHMGRYMLRGTLAGSSTKSRGQGSKSEVGTRGPRFTTERGSHGDASNYDSKAEYQRALKAAHAAAECRVDSLSVQKNVLHGLLSRVEGLIDTQSLLLSLSVLLPPLSTGEAVGVTNTIQSVGPASYPLALLTDAGLAVVCCFASRVLTGQLEVPFAAVDADTASQESSPTPPTALSVMRRPDEVFYTLLEVAARSRPAVQQSSQSSSSACSSSSSTRIENSRPSSGAATPEILDLLCSLLSLAPRLCCEEEALRKASAVSTSFLSSSWRPSSAVATASARDSSTSAHTASDSSQPADRPLDCGDLSDPLERLHGMMGGPLDREGCAVLILVLYALLDQGVHQARRRATGDVMEVAADPFVSALAKAIVRVALATSASKDAQGSRTFDSSSDRCSMLALYDVFERQALDTQDVTLAVGGLHLLSSLSEGTLLERRQASVAWTLLHTLHTQHTSLSTHLLARGAGPSRDARDCDSEAVPGTDDLWPHLASYVCPALSPSLDGALVEMQHGGNAGFFVASGNNASNAAVSAFKTAVGMSAATSRNLDLSFLAHSIASFRMIWTAWWGAEAPESRVKGVATLLLEIFRCHLLPPDPIPATGSSAKKGVVEKGKRGSNAPKIHPASTGGAYARARMSYVSPTTQDGPSFPTLCSDSLDALFALAVGMFPALFLLAQPESFLKHVEGDEDSEAGPYRSYVAVAKVFVWLLQQLNEVLEDGSQLHFIMRTSALCVRITRAVLVCVEGAIGGVAAWRSSQILPSTSTASDVPSAGHDSSYAARRASRRRADSDDSADDGSSMSDSVPERDSELDPRTEDDAEEDVDLGSVEYLACMLDWSQILAHRTIRYAEALKARMLHPESGLQVPRELSRATPQLQFTAERLAARILRTAKAHSVQLRDPEDVLSSYIAESRKKRDSLAGDEAISGAGAGSSKKKQRKGREDGSGNWGAVIKHQAEGFESAHRQVLLKPPCESLWCSIGAADPRSTSRTVPGQGNEEAADDGAAGECSSSSSETSDEEEEDDEEEVGHNGFVARYRKGRTSSGWGQRPYLEEEDEDEDDDEENQEEEHGPSSRSDRSFLPFPRLRPMVVGGISAILRQEIEPVSENPILVDGNTDRSAEVQVGHIPPVKRGRLSGRGDSMLALSRP